MGTVVSVSYYVGTYRLELFSPTRKLLIALSNRNAARQLPGVKNCVRIAVRRGLDERVRFVALLTRDFQKNACDAGMAEAYLAASENQ